MGWKQYCSENEFLSFEVVLLFALMFLSILWLICYAIYAGLRFFHYSAGLCMVLNL